MKKVQNIIIAVYLFIIACAIAFAAFQVWEYNDMAVKMIMAVTLSWVVVFGIRQIIHNQKLTSKTK